MNNMNNSAQKLKGAKHKFNIIDVLVVILVATIIGVSIYAVYAWSDIKSIWSKNTTQLVYVVELRGIDKEFIDNIEASEGSTVIDGVSKNQLGTIQNIREIKKYSVLDYEENQNNDPNTTTTSSYIGVLSEYPDKYNVTIYIEAKSAEYQKDIGYTVNGRRIAVGEIIPIRFPEFSADAYCVAGEFKQAVEK